MYLLLPPSETKRPGGDGAPLDLSGLRFATELTAAREAVLGELADLSRDPDAAARALKLGVKARAELAHNLRLTASPTLPAVARYTGVLYDSLAVDTLSPGARDWLGRHALVQSALFGLTGAADRVPAYRLSASSRLRPGGEPLKRLWQRAHAEIAWPSDALTVDLRSKDYRELAPIVGAVPVDVVAESADGARVSLNHFNKAGKGRFVRALAEHGAEPGSVAELVAAAAAAGERLEVAADGQLTLVTARG